MLLVKGFTLLGAVKGYSLYNCSKEERMSYTETQSHVAQERRLHWEMILCLLIHHLGDVLVNIRASSLDPVIRVGRGKRHISMLDCEQTNVTHFELVMRQKKLKITYQLGRKMTHNEDRKLPINL